MSTAFILDGNRALDLNPDLPATEPPPWLDPLAGHDQDLADDPLPDLDRRVLLAVFTFLIALWLALGFGFACFFLGRG
jgi:hypothetical protein